MSFMPSMPSSARDGLATRVNTPGGRPAYSVMREVYDKLVAEKKQHPCKAPKIDNQCAVRMSVALARAGLSLNSLPNRNGLHNGRPECGIAEAHMVRATELFGLLAWHLGPAHQYPGGCQPSSLVNRPGIVYFEDCSDQTYPSGKTKQTGDHIDLWTGGQIYNQILRIGSRKGVSATENLFGKAKRIFFFPLG
jgi:hypothetical protein